MLLLTCPFGLSALLRTECKRLGISSESIFPNGCRIQDDSRTTIATLNFQSRLANKVYLECTHGMATSFEELFQLVSTIDRSQRITVKQGCSLHVTTHDSMLHAPRSIQSVAHKAIIQQLNRGTGTRAIDPALPVVHIYIRIDNNIAYVMLNTSGDSLHQRGWRRTQGDAPCKEHLAIATLLLARRPFQQTLRDPCCGSGTLLIEAARLAKNIAAGKNRSFACEQYPQAAEVFAQQRKALSGQELDKSWTFIGSDIDASILSKAKQNAESAGVGELITFVHHDLLATDLPDLVEQSSAGTTVISNPPYGKRLQQEDIGDIHERLAELSTRPGRHGAILSGYADADHYFSPRGRKRKETRNGKDRVYIWTPKGAKPNNTKR